MAGGEGGRRECSLRDSLKTPHSLQRTELVVIFSHNSYVGVNTTGLTVLASIKELSGM